MVVRKKDGFTRFCVDLTSPRPRPSQPLKTQTTGEKQQGSVTSGLFALAYAHALCLGIRPEQLSFYEEYMWIHLSSCLSAGMLAPFLVLPCQRDTNGKELHGQMQEEVFCICRQPKLPQLPMISCDICEKWYHCRA
ncbi:hypothetical protein C0Q70_06423 [Pomacea canaliculata]|uniref:Uncharacterized protein n=1 Tax=Pomacea canaliculata TaxID=400727 RepID=A0A2T7PNZ6_POMCA|nr:hypothetical protein C0Q70_06423 [Pomacea canaliculata]